ncbi:ABC transporter substrate-binding protein [Rhodospirillum sp. A1_3_36]|uniref:ABC transporter substrate-binding protein n=1 Tax=Rhodospirillum sp. A1_3_36 TaxID=3391666 RepID=UPI0039A58B0C
MTVQPYSSPRLGRRAFLAGSAGALVTGLTFAGKTRAQGRDPILIGEINSYSRLPAFTLPYRNGWRLAVEQINGAGGLLGGRPLQVISKDDDGEPGSAVAAAQDLVTQNGVHALTGTFLSEVGLAVSDFAAQRKIPFLAAEPLTDAIVWRQGNHYTYNLRPNTYVQASILAREAAKLPVTRWATIAPNSEYGQSAVARFKQRLTALKRDVTFVDEQWSPLFGLDASATVQALEDAQPAGIFNALFGTDLTRFVQEGSPRGLFRDRTVVGMLTGEPENLIPLMDQTQGNGPENGAENWIVTGYPWEDITTHPHISFVKAYRAMWNEDPAMGSLLGYSAMTALAVAFVQSGGTEPEQLVNTLSGMTFGSPIGEIRFRPSDHQSTMGAWVGRTALRDGKGVMVDWSYVDGEDVLPPAEIASAWRPAEQAADPGPVATTEPDAASPVPLAATETATESAPEPKEEGVPQSQ